MKYTNEVKVRNEEDLKEFFRVIEFQYAHLLEFFTKYGIDIPQAIVESSYINIKYTFTFQNSLTDEEMDELMEKGE